MAQSTVIDQVTDTTAVVTGINSTKDKTFAVTLDKTSFANINKTSLIQKKTIEYSEFPCVFNLSDLTPATKYTLYSDYVSGSANVPENINSLGLEIKYIALTTGKNTFCVSPDGINWVGAGTRVFSEVGICGLWDGTKWIIGGMGTNSLATSTNGVTWNCLGNSLLHCTTGLTYNKEDNIYVAVGFGGSDTVIYSSNGTSWTGAGKPLNNIFDVSTNGITYVAVGDGITISFDGIEWIRIKDETIGIQRKIIWTGAYWVSFGDTTINYSDNGNTWTTILNTNKLKSAAWNGVDKWIAINESARFSSVDGITWGDSQEFDKTTNANCIVYGDKIVIGDKNKLYGAPTLMYSTDNGDTWTRTEQDINFGVNNVIYKKEISFNPGNITATPVTCPIMQNVTNTNDGFMIKISDVDFSTNTYSNPNGYIDTPNLNVDFSVSPGVQSYDLPNYIKYGFTISNKISSNKPNQAGYSYSRKIDLILDNQSVFTFEDDINILGRQGYIPGVDGPVYDQYRITQRGPFIRSSVNINNSNIITNSNKLFEKFYTDELKNRITSLPDTTDLSSNYNTISAQYDDDVKYIYYKLFNNDIILNPTERARLEDNYMFSRNGTSRLVTSANLYFPLKYKNQYSEILTYNNQHIRDEIIYATSNVNEINIENCNLSIICKNGLVSYYINNNLILIARQTIENRNSSYTRINSNSPKYTYAFDINLADSILSKKAYAQSLFFNQLLTSVEKEKIFYFLYLKTRSILPDNLKQTYQNYDFDTQTYQNIRLIYSCLLSVLRSNNEISITANGCALYQCINLFKSKISESIDGLFTTYLFNGVTELYNNIILQFNNNKNTYSNLTNTIGFLLSGSDITQLNNVCNTIISVISNSIQTTNSQSSFEILKCLEKIIPLNKSLTDLFELYSKLGNPITPATVIPILNAYNDGNGGGWYNTYYLAKLTDEGKNALNDDPALRPDTITYLTTYTNNTTNYATGTPLFSTETNDLKTYLKNRYDLLSNFIPDYSIISGGLFEPFINLINDINSDFREAEINEFISGLEFLYAQKDVFEYGLTTFLNYPNFRDLENNIDPNSPNYSSNQQLYFTIYNTLQESLGRFFIVLALENLTQTFKNDIKFNIAYVDNRSQENSGPSQINEQIIIPAGILSRTQIVTGIRSQLQAIDNRFVVDLDSTMRLKIYHRDEIITNIIFDSLYSANALGFLDLTTTDSIPRDKKSIHILLSPNPLFYQFYKFSFFLERLTALRNYINIYENIESSKRNAVNSAKNIINIYFKQKAITLYFPYVKNRLNSITDNVNDQRVLAEDNCTNGELSRKRNQFFGLKSDIITIIDGFSGITDGIILYNNILTISQKLSQSEETNTYFNAAREGFKKYFDTIALFRTKLDSYKESLTRRQTMFNNYLESKTPEIIQTYSGYGDDFIRGVLPTDTRFWKKLPDQNILNFPEYRQKWHYYDTDVVSYKGYVYLCYGLAIDNIDPTNKTYWIENPDLDASRFPSDSAYSSDTRYTHYSTVVYNNKVYSCIYEFPKDGLEEYNQGYPMILYNKQRGFEKLNQSIINLSESDRRLDSIQNLVSQKVSDNFTYLNISTVLQKTVTELMSYGSKVPLDYSTIINNTNRSLRNIYLHTPNPDPDIINELNNIHLTTVIKYYDNRPYRVGDIVYVAFPDDNGTLNPKHANTSISIYECIEINVSRRYQNDDTLMIGCSPTDYNGPIFWEHLRSTSLLEVKVEELYSISIYNSLSDGYRLFQDHSDEVSLNERIKDDIYGENITVNAVKAEIMFRLGYQGNTTGLKIGKMTGAIKSLGLPDVYEMPNNSNNTVIGYEPIDHPYVWKNTSNPFIYSNSNQYKIGNIVRIIKNNILYEYKCIYVPPDIGFIMNITPGSDLGLYWQLIESNIVQRKIKVDSENFKYYANDLVYVFNNGYTSANLEAYICNKDCNGNTNIRDIEFWRRNSTLDLTHSNSNLFNRTKEYSLGDVVVYPNIPSGTLDKYECINVDVPAINGLSDCRLEYKTPIHDLSPADSNLIWEKQVIPTAASDMYTTFATIFFNYSIFYYKVLYNNGITDIGIPYELDYPYDIDRDALGDLTLNINVNDLKPYSKNKVYFLNDYVLDIDRSTGSSPTKTIEYDMSKFKGVANGSNINSIFDVLSFPQLPEGKTYILQKYKFFGDPNMNVDKTYVRTIVIEENDLVFFTNIKKLCKWHKDEYGRYYWFILGNIECYKCIRAPLRFGLYEHYEGSFRHPEKAYYGIGPKSDIWKSRFAARDLRYYYALNIEHPKLEVKEKHDELSSMLASNSPYNISTFTFKCPDAGDKMTAFRLEFETANASPVPTYNLALIHLLLPIAREFYTSKALIDYYRSYINNIKQDFFNSYFIQQILNDNTDKYSFLNFDTNKLIDIGCGSRDTTSQPEYLRDDMIDRINYYIDNAANRGIGNNLLNFGNDSNNGIGNSLNIRQSIRTNQNAIKEYEEKIKQVIKRMNDLIGVDLLENIINLKTTDTLQYDRGGICDSIIIPLRGIDVNYQFLDEISGRFDDASGNMIDTSGPEYGMLTTLFQSLYDNYKVTPAYMNDYRGPTDTSFFTSVGSVFRDLAIGTLGLSSVVKDQNQIRKRGYQINKALWELRNKQFITDKSKNRSFVPIIGILGVYDTFITDKYNSEIIVNLRDLYAQSDIAMNSLDIYSTYINSVISVSGGYAVSQIEIPVLESYKRTLIVDMEKIETYYEKVTEIVNDSKTLEVSASSTNNGTPASNSLTQTDLKPSDVNPTPEKTITIGDNTKTENPAKPEVAPKAEDPPKAGPSATDQSLTAKSPHESTLSREIDNKASSTPDSVKSNLTQSPPKWKKVQTNNKLVGFGLDGRVVPDRVPQSFVPRTPTSSIKPGKPAPVPPPDPPLPPPDPIIKPDLKVDPPPPPPKIDIIPDPIPRFPDVEPVIKIDPVKIKPPAPKPPPIIKEYYIEKQKVVNYKQAIEVDDIRVSMKSVKFAKYVGRSMMLTSAITLGLSIYSSAHPGNAELELAVAILPIVLEVVAAVLSGSGFGIVVAAGMNFAMTLLEIGDIWNRAIDRTY